MQRHSLLNEGTLRIGMLFIGGYVNLFQMLNDYRQRYPGMQYRLTIDGSAALLNHLLSRSLHAAFLIGSENHLRPHDELYYQKVMDDYYIAVISTKNPLSRKELLTIEDLKDESTIMPAPSSAFRRRLEQLFARAGFEPRILCETSQTDLVNQLTRQNFGIGFFSCTIARALQCRELAAVSLEHTLYQSIYYVTVKDWIIPLSSPLRNLQNSTPFHGCKLFDSLFCRQVSPPRRNQIGAPGLPLGRKLRLP